MNSTVTIGDIDFTGNPTYSEGKAETGKFTNASQHQEVA